MLLHIDQPRFPWINGINIEFLFKTMFPGSFFVTFAGCLVRAPPEPQRSRLQSPGCCCSPLGSMWLVYLPTTISIYIYTCYKNQPFMATAMVHQFWVFVVASSSRYGQTHLTWSIRRTTHRCAGRLWGHSNRWHQPWRKRWHEAAGKACYESCLTYMDGI